ncbi:MAG: sulfite exporter TauE/SafE family protein [Thermodesulfobacteriota bacterium]|nr:sulfite exporter TauE/SafE family protein [Thermodesulfobacteriota bacterium]
MKISHIILLAMALMLLLVASNYQAISQIWSPSSMTAPLPPVASEAGDTPWYTMRLPVLGQGFNVLALVAIGFAVGILGRFFGMFGTWIVTPALNIFGFPAAMAVGTDLTRMTGESCITAYKYASREDVDPKVVVLFVMGMAVGIEIGVRTLLWLTTFSLAGTVIRIVYTLVLLGLSLFIILDYVKSKRQDGGAGQGMGWTAPPEGGTAVARKLQATNLPPMITLSSGVRVSFWTVLFIVMLTGWFFGLLGVVGGLLLLPAMIYLMGMLPTTATGIDLFSKVLSGTYGCLTYALKGQVEFLGVLWLFLGIVIGVQICARGAHYLRGQVVRLLFAIIMAVVGLSIVVRQCGQTGISQVMLLVALLAICAIVAIKPIHGFLKNRN